MMRDLLLIIFVLGFTTASAQYDSKHIPTLKQGKYYYANKDMVIESPDGYEYATRFCMGSAFIRSNGQYAPIAETFVVLGENRFEDIGVFNEFVCPVKREGKWGYMTNSSRVICNYIFDTCFAWHNGYGVGRIGTGSGIVNMNGELTYLSGCVVKSQVNEGYLLVKNAKGKDVLMNTKGKEVVLPGYADKPDAWKPVHGFSWGVLPVLVETKSTDTYGVKATGGKNVTATFTNYRFIDSTGKAIIERIGKDDALNYELVHNFKGAWAIVKQWNNFNSQKIYKVVDREGNVKGNFSYIYAFDEKYLMAKDNESMVINIFNTEMEPVATIEKRILKTGEFSEGLIRVYDDIDGAWGYLNMEGKTIIQFRYEDATDFNNGYALVKNKGRWFYINTAGKEFVIN